MQAWGLSSFRPCHLQLDTAAGADARSLEKERGWLCWTTCILGGGSWLGRDWFRASKMMTGAPECFSDQPPPLKEGETPEWCEVDILCALNPGVLLRLGQTPPPRQHSGCSGSFAHVPPVPQSSCFGAGWGPGTGWDPLLSGTFSSCRLGTPHTRPPASHGADGT